MPWFWSDEVALALLADGTIDGSVAAKLIAIPVAHRSENEIIEDAVEESRDDGEVPLAA